MRITSTEIARRLGISQSTVSRVFKNDCRISKKTSEKVLKLAKELNYRPNLLARSLVSGRTMTIGILTSGLHVESTSAKAIAIDALARKAGYKTSLVYTRGEKNRILATIMEMAENQFDGIVVINSGSESYNDDFCKEIAQLDIPVVFTGGNLKLPLNQVLFDSSIAYSELAEYLHKCEQKKVAVFWKKSSSGQVEFDVRLNKIFAACNKHFPMNEDNIFQVAVSILPDEIDDNFQARTLEEKKLISDSLNKLEKGSVVICHNDLLATAVMSTASSMGINIPKDISIVGFNNSTMAALMEPGLTTIGGNIKELAAKTFSMMLEIIKNPKSECLHEVVYQKLIIRNSVQGKNCTGIKKK